MKKALIVASTAGFAKGFLFHDMKLLRQMGYEVHCAANAKNMSFDADDFFHTRGISFHQIDFPVRNPFSKETVTATKQFYELLSESCFDFIHCHTPIVGAIVRMVAFPSWVSKKCRIIYTTHGLSFPKGSSIKNKLIYGGVEWLCGHICDGVITINYEDFNSMQALGCKRVYHINGVGVNTSRFHEVNIDRKNYRKSIGIEEDDVMVLAVGELSARKNHQVVIKALSEINDQRYVLVICGKAMSGNGTYEQLKQLAEERNVRVIFLGFRRDIPEITKCADIAVLPSVREGLGLAGIEALASGVPVIGSSVQGIKDYVIDGQTGYLCAPMDHKQFAGKIMELSDPHKRLEMRESCIEKAEEFSSEVSYRQMEAIYQGILRAQ